MKRLRHDRGILNTGAMKQGKAVFNFKVALSFHLNCLFLSLYLYYNKCFLWIYRCWVWKKESSQQWYSILSKCSQVLNIFYGWPVKYYLWRFGYMITRLQDRVQLSIYSTRALYIKYFVAMKYRLTYFYLCGGPPHLYNLIRHKPRTAKHL